MHATTATLNAGLGLGAAALRALDQAESAFDAWLLAEQYLAGDDGPYSKALTAVVGANSLWERTEAYRARVGKELSSAEHAPLAQWEFALSVLRKRRESQMVADDGVHRTGRLQGSDVLRMGLGCLRHGLTAPRWLQSEIDRREAQVVGGKVREWNAVEAFGSIHEAGTNLRTYRVESVLPAIWYRIGLRCIWTNPSRPVAEVYGLIRAVCDKDDQRTEDAIEDGVKQYVRSSAEGLPTFADFRRILNRAQENGRAFSVDEALSAHFWGRQHSSRT